MSILFHSIINLGFMTLALLIFLMKSISSDGFQIRRIADTKLKSQIRQEYVPIDPIWRISIENNENLSCIYCYRCKSKTTLSAINSESLMINGSSGKGKKGTISPFFEGIDVAALPEGGDLLPSVTIEPESPPMTFEKFVTMQEKRAVVTIRYSGDAGLKPYFLTVAKKLKQSHPDIIIERRILPSIDDGYYEPTFEILVEGKVVIGKGSGSRSRKLSRNGNNDGHGDGRRRSVYVSMNELDMAISRARRKHRPTTLYGSSTSTTTAANSNVNSKDDITKLQRMNGNKSNVGGMKNNNIDVSGKMDWSNM